MSNIEIKHGNALEVLKNMDDKSVDCVMTSPPYFALRDYKNKNQIGLEKTPEEYIDNLCNIFDEVKRVLKSSGTCWVNINDTYSGSGKGAWKNKTKQKEIYVPDKAPKIKTKARRKSLIGIPFMFALEMVKRGWILRNTIIWQKPNQMPTSAKDRFTTDFEYLFFFTKKQKYYFKQQKEPVVENSDVAYRKKLRKNKHYDLKEPYKNNFLIPNDVTMRNKRAIWKINTKPFIGNHIAVFPEELVITPLDSGCPTNGIVLDPFCGSGTVGVVAKKQNKNFIGIDINEDYCKLAKNRIKESAGGSGRNEK